MRDLHYRLDVNTLHRDEAATQLGLNEIGRVSLRVTQPLFCDPYARNRMTGGLILIDEATSATARRRDDHREAGYGGWRSVGSQAGRSARMPG